MLASAFYLVVNTDDGRMVYANAGHPPPFHVRRGDGVVDALGFDKGHAPALGIFEDADYRTGYCATVAQDLLVLFTDGLFEVEIANGEFYGQERLLTAVRDRMRLPAGNSSAKCSRKFGSAVCGANSRMTCVS